MLTEAINIVKEKKIVEQEAKEEVRKLTEPELEKVVGGAPKGEQFSQVGKTIIVPTEPSTLPYNEY